MGLVIGTEYEASIGSQWQIKFSKIANNKAHDCTYNENNEIQNYCVAGHSDGVAIGDNIDQLTNRIEDAYLR